MIKRRGLLLAAAAAILVAGSSSAQSATVTIQEVQALFQSRPIDVRRMVQKDLAANGYYMGAIDGSWGPGTSKAYRDMMASARYRRHAPGWTWPRDVQVMETMFFLNSDAYP